MRNNMKKLRTLLLAVIVSLGILSAGNVKQVQAEEVIEWYEDFLPTEPGDYAHAVGEGRVFIPSGRSDKYTYTIGDLNPYNIYVENIENGAVNPSKTSASPKAVISLEIVPDEHYELDTLDVVDAKGNAIEVSDEFTFVMPASDVTISATFKKKNYTVTFYDEDGTTVLQTVEVPYNERPSYTGDTLTKPEDFQNTYTFNGWTPTITHVTEDTSYKAEYTVTARLYTVEFKNEDTVLQSTDVEYGQYPSYTGPEPVKGDKVFVGWEPEISKVEGPQTYTAKFDEQAPTLCTITFIYNGDVVTTTQYDVGTQIAIPDVPPVIKNEQYQLQFREWSPTVEDGDEVSIDMTYVAQFDKIPQQYTIKWFNENKLLDEQVLDYGTAIVYTGAVPTKPSTEQYDYVFNGVWTADGVQRYDVVRKDTDLYAVFDEVLRKYPVTWNDEDGTEIQVVEVQYGKKVSGPAVSKDGMNFAGWYTSGGPDSKWDPTKPVKGELNLTAHYYPESTPATINGTGVMIASNDLEGQVVRNKYNDKPLVIRTNNGVIVIPANHEVGASVPIISNLGEDNIVTISPEVIDKLLDMNFSAHMFGIFLSVDYVQTIDDTLKAEDKKQGYTEVAKSGFEAEFREIYDDEGKHKHYDYPGTVTLTIDLDKMDIVLEEPPATMRRTFYAGHNYEGNKVEYLPMTISSDKKKADISVSTLSPFDIVYKDTSKPKPPTPAYNLPKTGVE